MKPFNPSSVSLSVKRGKETVSLPLSDCPGASVSFRTEEIDGGYACYVCAKTEEAFSAECAVSFTLPPSDTADYLAINNHSEYWCRPFWGNSLRELPTRVQELLIRDGDHIMLDDSSTSLYIAKHLKEKKKITVITNSIEIIMELSNIDGWTVISTGGRLKPESLAFVGNQAQENLQNYHVDIAVISCKGLDADFGISDSSEFHSLLKQAMMRSAKDTILALDSSKFDKASFVKISETQKISTVVTDEKPSKKWLELFKEQNISCIYP
jgi:hypothetical protein